MPSSNNYSLPFEMIRLKDNSFPKLLAKEIILNVKEPITKIERELKSISNTLVLLSNSVEMSFTDELIMDSYYLLTHKRLNRKRAKSIVIKYYENIDLDTEEILLSLLETIDKTIFYSKSFFALLLIDYLFLKKYKKHISITKRMRPLLLRMLKSKTDMVMTILEFKQGLKDEHKGNTLNLSDIYKFFYNNKEHIRMIFPIKRLYLFGSFADGMKNEKSDLDLLVIFNDEITGMQSLSIKNKLIEYLNTQLDINVDVIEFHYAMNYMDYMSLKKIKTIY